MAKKRDRTKDRGFSDDMGQSDESRQAAPAEASPARPRSQKRLDRDRNDVPTEQPLAEAAVAGAPPEPDTAPQGFRITTLEEEEQGIEGAAGGGKDSGGDPRLFPPKCTSDPQQGGNPNAVYGLPGPQVEPEAGAWSRSKPRPLPRVVPIAEVLQLTRPGGMFEVQPYPRDQQTLEAELAELLWLQDHRDDSTAVAGGVRKPISDFIQLHAPPFGAIFNIRDHLQYIVQNVNQQHRRRDRITTPVVRTGRELARMFEIETPGLLHRHALNYLLYKRPPISPPRQARIWMALDVTIYSALVACWHFKWLAGPDFSYRQRPYEYDRDQRLRVVYDDVVRDDGKFSKCARPDPCPSPGTPRHPAYPSGHSTYSAAASEILKYFFRDKDTQTELDNLADNIGNARLWAGVHWRSDHTAAIQVGKAVAYLVQQQLEGDCIPALGELAQAPQSPPDPGELEQQASDRRNQSTCRGDQDDTPTQVRTPFDDCAPAQPGETPVRVF